MSLFHEAYLFQPDAFARLVMPRVEALQTTRDGYSLLRTEAMHSLRGESAGTNVGG